MNGFYIFLVKEEKIEAVLCIVRNILNTDYLLIYRRTRISVHVNSKMHNFRSLDELYYENNSNRFVKFISHPVDKPINRQFTVH